MVGSAGQGRLRDTVTAVLRDAGVTVLSPVTADGDATGEKLGAVVLDATAGSDAGIDVVQSEYATIAAEQTALERLSVIVADEIVQRLALYARRQAAPQAAAPR